MPTNARTFNYSAFVAGWRSLCADYGLDAATGQTRVFAWPAEREQPGGAAWWADAGLWTDAGESHSVTEAAAIQSIAAQARAAMPKPAETLTEAMAREFRQIVKEVLAEELPLRELHRRRGVEVVELAGLRVEVAIRKTA